MTGSFSLIQCTSRLAQDFVLLVASGCMARKPRADQMLVIWVWELIRWLCRRNKWFNNQTPDDEDPDRPVHFVMGRSGCGGGCGWGHMLFEKVEEETVAVRIFYNYRQLYKSSTEDIRALWSNRNSSWPTIVAF